MKRFWISCSLVLASILSANAQEQGGLQIAKISGNVGAVAGNQIKVLTKEKEEFFAIVGNDTTLKYKGKAETSFLVPGILVRFTAEINSQGIVQEPLKQIEVFTISRHRLNAEQMREQTPGTYQTGDLATEPNGKKNAQNNKPAEKATAAKSNAKTTAKPSKKNLTTQEYRVVGQIVNVQNKKFYVQAGNAQIQFELDPKVEIIVLGEDPSLIQIGDEVKISGLRMASQEKFIQCETIEIVGAKPLSIPDPKANDKKTKSSKSKGKDGKDDKDDEGKVDDRNTKSGSKDKNDPRKTDPKSGNKKPQ
jgi:hypothetical protein